MSDSIVIAAYRNEAKQLEEIILQAIERDLESVGQFLFRRMEPCDFVSTDSQTRYDDLRKQHQKTSTLILNGAKSTCQKLVLAVSRLSLLAASLRTYEQCKLTLESLENNPAELAEILAAHLASVSQEGVNSERRVLPFYSYKQHNTEQSVIEFLDDLEVMLKATRQAAPTEKLDWGPLHWLNARTGGIPPASVSLILGSKGAGKSLFAQSVLLSAVAKDQAVHLMSLRDSVESIARRLLTAGAQIDLSTVSKGISTTTMESLMKVSVLIAEKLTSSELVAPHASLLTPMAERALHEHGFKLIVIEDIDSCLARDGKSLNEIELRNALRQLSGLARRTGVRVVVTCHADIGDTVVSHSHCADYVFHLHPPELGSHESTYSLEILRNALGPLGSVKLILQARLQGFFEYIEGSVF
ncbi:MAG: RAD55 family ATPase [Verrucomicrobiales bacterium]